MADTSPNIILVPLLRITAIKIDTKNKNGSKYDSHMIINIITAQETDTIRIHDGKIGVLEVAILPLVKNS